MPADRTFPGRVLEFFTRLIGGSSPEAEAEQRAETLIRSAALLERAKTAPSLPLSLRVSLSSLTRLVYLSLSLGPDLLARDKALAPSVESFAGKALAAATAKGGRSAADAAKLADEARALCSRLMPLLEHSPALHDLNAEGGAVSLRERMILAEVRALARELDSKRNSLPEDARDAAGRIRELALEVAAYCEEHRIGIARHSKYLKKYLGAALTVSDGMAAMREPGETATPAIMKDDAATLAGREILTRIADAFAAERQALIERQREDFSIDLAVVDTLLRMEGK